MWPWGHLAVGYLCYVASIRFREDGKQALLTLLAVAIGSQFPDLIDKPLAWSAAVLPSGRSFAHSLLTATVVIGILYWGSRLYHHEEPVFAFGLGYISHSLADLGPEVLFGLLQGEWNQLQWTTYLLWPLFSPPPYSSDSSFVEHFMSFALDSYVLVQFVLFGIAIAVWIGTGTPGLTAFRLKVYHHLHRRL